MSSRGVVTESGRMPTGSLSHGVLALASLAFVVTASCARAPKQPDPGQGYTLETTGAVVGLDEPRHRNEPDPTVGEAAARLSGQICEREARCHGGGPVSEQCMRAFTQLAVLEVVTWPCSPAATRSRVKECIAALNAEPCQMNLATKPALCPSSPACPDPRASLVPSGAVLAQEWRGAAPRSLDYDAAIAALDAIDVKLCAAKAIDEGVVQAQEQDQADQNSRRPRTMAHITVTFAPDGGVLTSTLDRGPDGGAVDLSGTATGECVVERFRKARVPTFDGPPWNVGVAFLLD